MSADLTDRQRECVEAYERNFCSEKKAAKELGIDVKAMRVNLWLAAKKGWKIPQDDYLEQAPSGFVVSHGTMHIVDGKVKQYWPRIKPGSHDAADFANFLRQRTPVTDFKAPRVQTVNKNLMLEWPIYDAHHGMLAWAAETGADYDHKISRHLQVGAGSLQSLALSWVASVTAQTGSISH